MMESTPLAPPAPTFRDLFTPKLVTVLRAGYGLPQLQADVLAGLTVAIVALPLSMAIAIASGTTPERGLYTAVVGGFIVSALGGSRFQIGGPAGAFIVLVSATIERHGLDGFFLATFLAGLILVALGLLRLGLYIKYIPQPVTIGFTAGIAIIIFASQLRDLFGLTLPGREPSAFWPKLQALWEASPSINPAAVAVSAATIATILVVRRFRPRWPAFLIAIAAASVPAALLGLPVETIGTRFGGIPNALPLPALPEVSVDRVVSVLPDALALALLGGIESLLSAVVADTMTGRRHRSNCELVAQGLANMASALFGGICATGTIARTATNVRSGAVGPVSGMLHSGFLLAFMLLAAPLASYIPLAALAGLLAVVAWGMAERHEFWSILRRSRGEAAVLLATFLLTVFRDLTEGIVVGVTLGSFLFMHRMTQVVSIEAGMMNPIDDVPDDIGRGNPTEAETAGDTLVCRFSGPLFFGASTSIAATLERIGGFPRTVILDLSRVPLADSSAAASLKGFVDRALSHGSAVLVAGAAPGVRKVLQREGLDLPPASFLPDIAEARAAAGSRELAKA
ncbi:MAG TPA: SulP family inorganic anion transporter [Microvirga sp.]|nr:SulP family inorganic anion transporter [Microvirga sp.]